MAGGLQTLANLLGKVNANNALVVALDGGVASASVFLGGDGTAGAPTFSFTSDPTNGLYLSGTDALGLSAGGVLQVQIQSNTLWMIRDAAGLYWGAAGDLSLFRDAANTLAQRNGVNAQVSRGYRTFTDTSNYQRWALQTGAAYVELAAETAGTGADDISVKLTPAGLGHTLATLGRFLDKRAEAAETTDGNATYTAAQVLGGVITRSNMSANRVDAFPTAANLVAAIPGCLVGTSFDVIVNNNDTAQTVTVNGASNGITYEGTATAIAAAEARLFKVLITNITGAAEAATVFQVV